MNERQADAQHKLSHGRPLGQSSLNDENLEEDDARGKSKQSSSTGDDTQITKKVFFGMLFVATLLDLFGFLLNLIAVVGGAASDILIWFPGMIFLFVAYLKLGVKFSSKNSLKIAGCSIIELIPVLNALPGFMLSVILTLGPMVAKDIIESVPGGEKIANKVQQAISTRKNS